MNAKKKLSGVLVFGSVFFGSLLGAGITLITSPGSGRDFKGKVKVTVDILKESVSEHLDNAAIRLIEQSSVLKARTKMKFGEMKLGDVKSGKLNLLVDLARQRFKGIKSTLKK
jgi:hypothetical protein